MDTIERVDEQQLRRMPTSDLVRRAVEEAKLLARAEVMHAKAELREEFREAKLSGMFIGVGGVLALCGLAVLFVALALVLPMAGPLAALIVGVALLVIAGALALVARSKVPKKPLRATQERLRQDYALTKEQLV